MKRPFPLLLACFFLLALSASSQTKETEPNNISGNASMLLLDSSGYGAIDVAGDNDWWQVKTNDDGELDITVQNLNNASPINLQLYDKNAKSLLNNLTIPANSTVTMPTDGRGAGTYFIKLFCSNNDTAPYVLSDTVIAAFEQNDVEPNNNQFHQNTLIHLNDTVTGHIGYKYNGGIDKDDWFVFKTTEDGNIRIKFKNESGVSQISAELWDSTNDLRVRAEPANTEDSFYLNINGVQAGAYFVHVTITLLLINSFGPYKFFIQLDSTKHVNDIEPNNLPTQALTLPVNTTTQGHIEFYYDGKSDSADWYSLTLPQDGMLKLYISGDSKPYGAFLNLLDADNKTILSSGSTDFYANTKDTLITDGLNAGTYYLKVTGAHQFDYETYTLENSFFTYNYAADTLQENNNAAYISKEITSNRTLQGHAGFYYNNQRDTSDWWKLNYTDASGRLLLDFNLLSALIDSNIRALQVQLFGDTLSPPIYSGILKDSSDSITLSGLNKGIYYIKLNCAVDSEWCAYAFKAFFNGGVLATTFLNFSGSIQNNKPVLQWVTNNETNFMGFDVERSVDGFIFYKIGFVDAKHTSTTNNYSFSDNTAPAGKLYYRLKEIDNSGSYTYSSIVLLNLQNFNWYVSCEQKDCKVFLQLSQSSKTILQVVSANGTIIQTINKGNLAAGNYSIPLNMNNKPSGIYCVSLLFNGNISSKQFFKP